MLELCKKLVEPFPFRSEILQFVVLLDPNKRGSIQIKDVLALVDRFLPGLNDTQIDKILEEW